MQLTVRPTGILIKDGKILLVRQDVTEKRHWALPGGRLESDETIEHCLVREMKEETGLDVAVEELLYLTDRFYRDTHIIHMLFLVTETGGQLRKGLELKGETETIKELTMTEIDQLENYGFSMKFREMVRAGFPERGSYQGDFNIFYGE